MFRKIVLLLMVPCILFIFQTPFHAEPAVLFTSTYIDIDPAKKPKVLNLVDESKEKIINKLNNMTSAPLEVQNTNIVRQVTASATSGDQVTIITISDNSQYDTYEPNNNFSNIKLIPYNRNVYATMENSNDIDCYVQYFEAGRQFEIFLSDIPINCDYDLYLFTLDGTCLGSSTHLGDSTELLRGFFNISGYYAIVIVPYNTFNATSQYKLFTGDFRPIVSVVTTGNLAPHGWEFHFGSGYNQNEWYYQEVSLHQTKGNSPWYFIPANAKDARIIFDWFLCTAGPDHFTINTEYLHDQHTLNSQQWWCEYLIKSEENIIPPETSANTWTNASGFINQPLHSGDYVCLELFFQNNPDLFARNHSLWITNAKITYELYEAAGPTPVPLPPSTPTPTLRPTATPTPIVTPTNHPPVLASVGNKTVAEGAWLQFTVNATDPDGDPLTYSATGLPYGATFDPNTRTFRWIPDFNQAGKPNPQITFRVADGRGGEDSETITITVTDAVPVELLPNPSFDNGTESWWCISDKSKNASTNTVWDTSDFDTAPGSLKVQCISQGAAYNDIQLFTNRFTLEKDKTYLLTFKAKSSASFTIPSIKLNQAGLPWNDYAAPYTNLTVSTGWQSYAAIFTANTTANDGRLTFFLGNALPAGATFNIDTLSLKQIVVYPPSASELLPNPDFNFGPGNWNFYTDTSAQANGCLDAGDFDSAPASYRIQCVNNGDTLNSIQLFTMPLSIEQNKTYQLTFRAKSTSIFAVPLIKLMKATSPWTLYANPYSGLTITNDWQSYTITFTANTTAIDGRITFFLGNALPDGATFWIDSLSLREATP